LNISPTFGQQFPQKTFLQRVHCQAGGFMNPPTCFPQVPQNPLTKVIPSGNRSRFNLRLMKLKYLESCLE